MNTQPWKALVADIGGTNARFALVDNSLCCQHHQNLLVAEYPTPLDAINHYLRQQNTPCPPAVGIAAACPTDTQEVIFTNSHWHFHKTALKQQLGCVDLLVINDFAALAHEVPNITSKGLVQLGGNAPLHTDNLVVLGPGTGFGVAGITRQNSRWLPISGEGGHIEWAALTQSERDVQRLLLQDLPRLSIERILQGKGLQLLYKALCTIKETPSHQYQIADITTLGINGECEICRDTLMLYCNILGSVAGDMALLFGARGGVYIGGGIAPRLLDFFQYTHLRERFENKGRMSDYNRSIPCFIITVKQSALNGMVIALQAHEILPASTK